MFNQTTKLSSNQGYQPQVSNSNSKSLAGASESQVQTAQSSALTLDQWKAAAQVWFDKAHGKIALEKGETMPTQAEYAQMTEYWNWANQQSGGWNPMGGGQQGPVAAAPAGAKIGPMGSIVFNSEKAETTYEASATAIDVLSDEFTLNVDQKVQDVVVEKTTDSRIKPATEVIKITVKDRFSVPNETVYYVQPDAKININTIGGKGVTQKGTDALKLADGTAQINVAATSAKSAEGTNATGVTGGESKETAPKTWTHTANVGETLDYIVNKDAAATEHHTFYGPTNVGVPADCKINISESAGNLVFTVTNKDGKVVSEGTVMDGFSLQVNHANEKSITIGGKAIAKDKDGKITNGLEDLNINGTKTTPAPAAPAPAGTGPFVLADSRLGAVKRFVVGDLVFENEPVPHPQPLSIPPDF